MQATYDALYGIPADEVLSMAPKKTFGQQLFDWLKGPGSLILAGAIAVFSLGGKLSDFRNEITQMRVEQTSYTRAVESIVKNDSTRNEILSLIMQAQIDSLKLLILPYGSAERRREAEKIITRLEQKKISQVGHDYQTGGLSGIP